MNGHATRYHAHRVLDPDAYQSLLTDQRLARRMPSIEQSDQ